MVTWKSKKLGDILTFANGFVVIILINLLVGFKFYRIDLTEEKRYSVKPETQAILENLEDDIHVEIFLEEPGGRSREGLLGRRGGCAVVNQPVQIRA